MEDYADVFVQSSPSRNKESKALSKSVVYSGRKENPYTLESIQSKINYTPNLLKNIHSLYLNKIR